MTAQIILFPRSPDTYIHTLTEWAKQRNGRLRAMPVNGGRGPTVIRLRPAEKRTTVALPINSPTRKVYDK